MKKLIVASLMLACMLSTSVGAQETEEYVFTPVKELKLLRLRIRTVQEHAGLFPVSVFLKLNCCVWEKGSSTFRKCLS